MKGGGGSGACLLLWLSFALKNSGCLAGESDERFYPSARDDDHNFPIYPFQQYIQVRKSVSVEHVPVYESASEQESSSSHKQADGLEKAASHNEGSSTGSYGGDQQHYYKPPLKEEVFLKKKQEVYEERGYHDGHYDHYKEGAHSRESQPQYADPEYHEPSESRAQPDRYGGKEAGTVKKRAIKKPVGSDDASSTRVLEHIANNLYDRDGHAVGFYKARSHIYCPEVIDFNLSSKSQRMGEGLRPKGKPRLSGLGSKIDCLKRKYWGGEILPSSVFMDPSESRHSEIKIGSLSDFWGNIKKDFHSARKK